MGLRVINWEDAGDGNERVDRKLVCVGVGVGVGLSEKRNETKRRILRDSPAHVIALPISQHPLTSYHSLLLPPTPG